MLVYFYASYNVREIWVWAGKVNLGHVKRMGVEMVKKRGREKVLGGKDGLDCCVNEVI